MKKHFPISFILLLSLFIFTGCEFLGDIFQTGVGVGVFITVIVVAVILYIISRFRKR